MLCDALNEYLKKNHLSLVDTPEKIILSTMLNLKCDICNTEFKISVRQLLYPHPERRHTACPTCSAKQRYLDKLEDLYGEVPYDMISPFAGYMQPLTVKCHDCGYIFTVNKAKTLLLNAHMTPGHHPCKNCAKLEYASRKKSQSIDEFRQQLVDKFGECSYIFPHPEEFRLWNQKEKMHIICGKCGHEMFTYPNNILNPRNKKHYCRVCNKKNRLLESMSYKERCEAVTNGKITPLEKYIDSKTPILHRCNECGYIWKKIPVKNTLRNAGCPKCKKRITVSMAEAEVKNYIQTIYAGTVVLKDRSILKGKEIDIYLPEIKLGFEIDGLYYHSSKYKDKMYHLNKQLMAAESGITLIHIYDAIWYHEQPMIKQIIQAYITHTCGISMISTMKNSEFIVDRRYAILGDPIFNGYKLVKIVEPSLEYFSNNLSAANATLTKRKMKKTDRSIYNCGYLIYRKENI